MNNSRRLVLILSAISGLLSFVLLFFVFNMMKQKESKPMEEIAAVPQVSATEAAGQMLIRLAVIEVYPEYLQAYLDAASTVGGESVAKEPGVVCIFPMQMKNEPNQVRIIEIYRNQEAYQSHLQTEHFLTYKNGTLHMVKSLDLQEMRPMHPEAMPLIFNKFFAE